MKYMIYQYEHIFHSVLVGDKKKIIRYWLGGLYLMHLWVGVVIKKKSQFCIRKTKKKKKKKKKSKTVTA